MHASNSSQEFPPPEDETRRPDSPSHASAPDEPNTHQHTIHPDADQSPTIARADYSCDEITRSLTTTPTPYPPPLPEVPGYEVKSILGKGGMGIVYKAIQNGLNRTVALKMIRESSFTTEADLHRFRTEAEAVATLHHPNVVQIYEVGEVGGYPFFSLECVEGGSLSRRLAGEPIAPHDAAQVTAVLAAAMQYAHENRIVHRDLKPANILLAPNPPGITAHRATGTTVLGRPKIADFGLAKRLGETSSATVSGTIMGTPSYMAPEQATGNSNKVGPGADIYALGAIFYEMLTGVPPFRSADYLETLDMVRKRPPVPPSLLRRGIPADLEIICLKCLSKEVQHRYASCQDLVDDLSAFLDGRTIRARRVRTPERIVRWCRRNPVPAMLLGGIGVSLLLGAIVSTYFAFKAAAGERRAIAGEVEAIHRKRESDRQRYVAQFQNAWTKWNEGRLDEVAELLDGLIPTPGEPDLRGFEWHYLQRICCGELRTVEAHSGGISQLLFTPDRRFLISSGTEGTIALRNPSTGQQDGDLIQIGGRVSAISLSSDGRHLAVAAKSGVFLVELSSRNLLELPTRHPGGVLDLAFHPTEQRLVTCGFDGSMTMTDLTTGTVTSFPKLSSRIFAVAFSRDGNFIFTAEWDRSIAVRDLNGAVVRRLLGHTKTVNCLTVRADGLLASGEGSGEIKLWLPGDDRPRVTLLGHSGAILSLDFSPDGNQLVSGSSDRTIRIWDVEKHREVMTMRSHSNGGSSVAFAPEGRRVVSGSYEGILKFWDLVESPERQTIPAHTHLPTGVAFTSTGELISTSRDGTIRQWSPRIGLESLRFATSGSPVLSVAVRPEHPEIATVSKEGISRWNTQTGALIQLLQDVHLGPLVSCCKYSPDGRYLAAGGANDIVIWDLTTGEPVQILADQPASQIFFGPDGNTLHIQNPRGRHVVWDRVRDVTSIIHELQGRCSAISPDGRWLVGGTPLQLIDREQNTVLREFKARGVVVEDVVFSPDGRRLASVGLDLNIRIWDTDTGAELLCLTGLQRVSRDIAFSPDGLQLTASCENGVLYLWQALKELPEDEREAISLVRFWSRPKPDPNKMIDCIRHDCSATDGARQMAIQFVERLFARGAR